MSFRDGSVRPFVVRGPLCDGLGGDELLALLRDEEGPPIPPGGGRRIGVFARGVGARPILSLFSSISNATAMPVYRFQPSHLGVVEALVVSRAADPEDLSPEAVQALRGWVAEGGTLLLTHDAVGARWHPRMFPEVGVGGALNEERALVLARDVGVLKAGSALEHASTAHVRIVPAQGAEILLRETGEKGAPVAVSGAVGKGRVILYGAAPGGGPGRSANPSGPSSRVFLAPPR